MDLLVEGMDLFTFILTIVALSVPASSVDVTIKGKGTVRGILLFHRLCLC